MRKRILSCFIITFIFILSVSTFSACKYIGDRLRYVYEEKHSHDFLPHRQFMTKWEGDIFELFVIDSAAGVLVCHFPNKTALYDVQFRTYSMNIVDRINQDIELPLDDYDYDNINEPKKEDEIYEGIFITRISYGDRFFSWTETTFKARFHSVGIDSGLFPLEEITFKRTAVDLTASDIPHVEAKTGGDTCPAYKMDSTWVDLDNGVTIDMPQEYKKLNFDEDYSLYSYPIGKINNLPYSDQESSIIFSIFDSHAYIVETPEQNSIYDIATIATAQEVWDCEFFEDYFIATVQESPYYEPGTILRFSLISE